MATLYFCALPSATTPTWNRANIGTNAGFSDSPPMYGTQASAPDAPQTNYEPTITWTGSLTAGTSYKLWAIWDDGASSSNSGAPFGSAAFTTLTSVTSDLDATYAVLAAVTSDLSATYTVEGSTTAVTSDLSATYDVLAAVTGPERDI